MGGFSAGHPAACDAGDRVVLLITFIISLDEFIISFFLSGNVTTLPVYIYGLRRQSDDLPIIMALGTILVTLSICLLVGPNFSAVAACGGGA